MRQTQWLFEKLYINVNADNNRYLTASKQYTHTPTDIDYSWVVHL